MSGCIFTGVEFVCLYNYVNRNNISFIECNIQPPGCDRDSFAEVGYTMPPSQVLTCVECVVEKSHTKTGLGK